MRRISYEPLHTQHFNTFSYLKTKCLSEFVFCKCDISNISRQKRAIWNSCEIKTYIYTNIPITVEQIFTTNYCQTEIPRIPIFHVPWS